MCLIGFSCIGIVGECVCFFCFLFTLYQKSVYNYSMMEVQYLYG
uniref:Uncharacterized protein n=1 Tax=Rhizophora mucronata TaxID=61149 RepID=A0A2P2N6U9_RHIMU